MPRDLNPGDEDLLQGNFGYHPARVIHPSSGVGRHFLLVCGPFGPFTSRLGQSLRGMGARCSRVVLNGGDVYDWGLRHAPVYLGPRAGFGAWLARRCRLDQVTDIIIYGDSHPYCIEAARTAARLSLSLHVLEQGYFRPFWITLEPDGVNGNSSLPSDPEVYRRAAAELSTPQDEWLPPLTPPAVWKLALYHTALWLAAPAFPAFRLPYRYSLPRQGLGHARRYLDSRLFRRRHQRRLAALLAEPGPLFIAILQRPGDSQLERHSPFATTAEFIDRVVASFSRGAPAASRLVFKAHPLDHGLEPHARSVAACARAHGVGDRVFFIDFGDLQAMLPLAAGAVTVNSTAGLSSIAQGAPTVALGTAIYDMPGLTHQAGLDEFWARPQAPDRLVFEAFRKVVIARTQISGAYAVARGIERAVPEVVRRLLSGTRAAARPAVGLEFATGVCGSPRSILPDAELVVETQARPLQGFGDDREVPRPA